MPSMVLPPPVNPEDLGRGPLVMGVTWSFSGLALIAVAMRFWVRVAVTKQVKIEDWLMLLAVLLNTACVICLTLAFHYGFGKHDLSLTFDQAVHIGKWIWMSFTPGITSSIASRISIAVLLVRIFGIHVWLKWSLIAITVLQVVASMVLTLTSWCQVRPVQALWNPTIPARRISPDVVAREGNVTGALFALGDILYVLLPVIVVFKLTMPMRRKIGLIILLALSIFTMGCSIAKAVYAESGTKAKQDKQYTASLSLMWSVTEQTFVIIMGCAPPLSSVTKLNVPFVSSLGASIKKLVSSRASGSQTGASSEQGQSKNGIYYELGVAGKTVSDVQANSKKSTWSQSETDSIDPGTVRRTDQFDVRSDRGEV
ncbi:hypothetical protein FB567DRAFT_57350 [Paraphoma chrysanthemicola]|uniref:Rhodopsin domain-containing protein n=1 Tax=Paraphoma chrysanthemicola TaxID=798071 RepID=A0A8K0VXS7_9PLEO|nr:hypothetical protein FB567DRAFT_57350 [Paraphoma chrysanthemicola]